MLLASRRTDASATPPRRVPGRQSGVTPGLRTLRRTRLALDDDLVLGEVLERLAAISPDRVLVDEVGGARRTLAGAADLVDRWAASIAAQVEPGATVVVATPNGYDQLLVCLAASRAGAIPAPVNDRLRAEELDHVVADSGADLVVRDAAELSTDQLLGRAHPADPGAVGAVFYTSGTTGLPKGAELSHRGILGGLNRAALVAAAGRTEEAVFSLPMAHIMGFVAAVGLACATVPARFLPRFEAEAALDEIETRRAGIFIGVPAMYRMLLDAGAEERDLASVKLWVSGADAMPAELAERFCRMGAIATLPGLGKVGRAVFAEGYGMVETAGGVAARVALPYLPSALGRLGVPLPGYRTRVVDEAEQPVAVGVVGELQLSGPGVLKGYRGDEDATRDVFTEDGWLRTGDLVRRGLFGVFSFEGRAKEVIVRGGYNVYAVEVEQVLERHPDVAEAAVVGLADDRLGEVPVAAVTGRARRTLEPDALRDWAKDHLSAYKVPVQIRIVDELPHSATRKVQRAEVRALFAD